MLKNKSYIGISFIILIFGIYAIPKIIDRIQNDEIVKGDRLDAISNSTEANKSLVKIGLAPKFELLNLTGQEFSSRADADAWIASHPEASRDEEELLEE